MNGRIQPDTGKVRGTPKRKRLHMSGLIAAAVEAKGRSLSRFGCLLLAMEWDNPQLLPLLCLAPLTQLVLYRYSTSHSTNEATRPSAVLYEFSIARSTLRRLPRTRRRGKVTVSQELSKNSGSPLFILQMPGLISPAGANGSMRNRKKAAP